MRIKLPKKKRWSRTEEWFAWYPVKTTNGYLVWLENVWKQTWYPDTSKNYYEVWYTSQDH